MGTIVVLQLLDGCLAKALEEFLEEIPRGLTQVMLTQAFIGCLLNTGNWGKERTQGILLLWLSFSV